MNGAADTARTCQMVRMERMYRTQRHIYDLTRRYYLLGRERLLAGLPAGPGANILEMGCGTGRNLIWLAKRRPGTGLCGIDASSAMLRTASDKAGRAGARLRLARVLAEELCPGRDLGVSGGFNAVYFSYVLSMIDDPRRAVEAAWSLVAPGGVLAVLDFGDFAGLPGFAGRALTAWLALFGVRPGRDLAPVLSGLPGAPKAARQDLYRGYATLYRLNKHGGE